MFRLSQKTPDSEVISFFLTGVLLGHLVFKTWHVDVAQMKSKKNKHKSNKFNLIIRIDRKQLKNSKLELLRKHITINSYDSYNFSEGNGIQSRHLWRLYDGGAAT